MSFEQTGLEVAVIGISGRFPGSENVDLFWDNLVKGADFISVFSSAENQEIKAGGVLNDIDMFDASFFGFSPREAAMIDPQHRLLLECAWEALEKAGYDSEREERPIGVYGGIGSSTYLLYNLSPNNLKESLGYFPTLLASDKDYAPTRVSYKLNLTGPSVSVGTACSSSLVAVHLAYKGLLSGECDIALATGVAVKTPQNEVTLCPEGISPDGRCFAFDARANGTIGGNGVGVVVLKRLEDAIADGDYIYAVIKGSALNNDGAYKVSYTAPSENAQAKVIRSAQIMAEVEPETITYIETHGTGTPMGDPIEIAALKQAFQAKTDKKGYCAIGSVKTNIGHLDAAAGIASLIKTVLALHHKSLPPSLNFQTPNPQIDFENSPFYVNNQLSEWKANGTPRRAGVSSFGFGGTNAHVILEEAPPAESLTTERTHKLLLLSAKTSSALEKATANLVEHIKQHPDLNLADVAYTLEIGRRGFDHRLMVVCQDIEDAAIALQDPKRVFHSIQEMRERSVALMFTGLGTHYVNMGWELYQSEPTFQGTVDRCCEFLKPLVGVDMRDVLYPNRNQPEKTALPTKPESRLDFRSLLGRDTEQLDEASEKLNQTYLTQPAFFVIEYALAQLLSEWGIRPTAMIGYSIGEYVAATLAGVLSLEDALTLVATRAKMIQELPNGAMLAVPLSEIEVRPLLSEKLSLSAINGSKLCVVAGATDAVEELATQLTQLGLVCRRLQTSHAFHSYMMEAIADSFTKLVTKLQLQPPQIPYISNVTGTWITNAQATDPSYWTQHLCQPVRFADGINNLWEQQHPILLEVGPGQTLSSLAMQCLDEQLADNDKVVLPSLRHSYERQSDVAFLLNTLGQLWLSGVQIDWSGFYTHERRRRLPLPTYPFERQRYWIDPPELPQLKLTPSDLWQSLVDAGHNQASASKSEFDEQTYQEQKLWMDRLCIAYINQTLKDLGAFQDQSEKYSFEELLHKCQIIPHYEQLWRRWLQILVEQKHLQQDEQGLFTDLLPLSTQSVQTLLEEVRLRWGHAPETVDILERCGENLTAVLTGKKQALEFHVAKFAEEDEVPIQNLPSVGYYKVIMQATLARLVKSLPADVNLRILEIGGGQGIATEEMLAVLPPQTKYLFTDVGSWFLNTAEQKYKNYPFVEYGFLDIERPLTEQGYSNHSFDVVIAVNVLHVVRNIGEALENVRSLLAPGGLLLMWEITQPELLFDVADGLLMNPVEDKGRNQGNPFLSQEQWQQALLAYGFVEVAAFSEIDAFGQHILLAQTASTSPESISTAFTTAKNNQNLNNTPQVLFGKKPDIADWFYIPSWKRSMVAPLKSQPNQSGRYLIFVDECGLATQIVQRLQLASEEVITVKIGEQFKSESNLYTVNPQQPDNYGRLLRELRTLNLTPTKIIHFWSVTSSIIDETENLGFYSLLFLAQALGEQNLTESIEIEIVSNNMQAVTGSEELYPEKALILGPCKVIPLEYSNIKCHSIDVVIPHPNTWQEEELVNQLLSEFTNQTFDQIVAYRGVHRWVQTFEPVRLEQTREEKPSFREGGVYLITGGLGGVGLTVAEYLARTVKAKLILTGRSAFPVKSEWLQWLNAHDEQNEINLKIRKIQELEALGAEVLIVSADVTDSQQMSEAIRQANQQFGQIHGVIHAAFIPRGCMIQRITKETSSADVGPKVKGTKVLATLFQDVKLDFFLLFSSIYAFEPLAGQVDYVAESAFLDAFAYYSISRKHSTFIRSINWDGWSGIGAAVSFTAKYKEITGKDIRDGMTTNEGIEAFKRILESSKVPQIIVSTHDLLTLITKVEENLSLQALEKSDISKPIRQRPELKNDYVAPSNELEFKIVESFQKFLGFEQVGIYDNFFALGGDSLTGSVLIKQLGENFQIELPLRVLYEAPTIAELGVAIEKILIEELQELTEEEANLILQKTN